MKDREITLINDGDGIAVIGESKAVDLFMASEGIQGRQLDLPSLSRVTGAGSAAAQTAAELTTQSGRWIKLTEKSATQLAKGTPMKGSSPGVSRAILTEGGKTKSILEFSKTPASMASNPAVLAGAAGLMAQLAMQQTMSEITDYLATIDAKLDDVLRAQKDAVVADMIGVGMVIDEAMTIREGVGGVSEVTWSKVQSTTVTIARTQAYALTQVDDLTAKLARERRINEIADTARELESKIHEWLAILARCFQLQDGMAVLELDRLLAVSSHEVDAHRQALRLARQNRRDRIAETTQGLLERLDVAATTANAKVLTNPLDTPKVLTATRSIASKVDDFHGSLGIVQDRESVEARSWREAAAETRAKAVDATKRGTNSAKRIGGGAVARAKSASSKASRNVSARFGKNADEDARE